MSELDRKILIIGSTPYSNSSQARAFSTYLYNWREHPDLIRQIYTRPVEPNFDFCNEFYQLTDKEVLKRTFSKKQKGKLLSTNNKNLDKDNVDTSTGSIFNFFKNRKNCFTRLLRSVVWGKKRWQEKELVEWVENFKPDLIFLSFGDDLHLFRMASFFANRLNIPIVTVISDDYFFLTLRSPLIFKHIYNVLYKKSLVDLFNNQSGFGVAFNSERICKAYVDYFDIKNYSIVPIAYSKEFSELKNTNKEPNIISYFGNFECGRYKAICEFAKALEQTNYVLKICGPITNKHIQKEFSKRKNISYLGNLSYSNVVSLTENSDYVLIVESFKPKDSRKVKFSLSTKVGDCLVSGKQIIAIGHKDSGLVDFFKDKECALICSESKQLNDFVDHNLSINKKYIENAKTIALNERNIGKNGSIFYDLCMKLFGERH